MEICLNDGKEYDHRSEIKSFEFRSMKCGHATKFELFRDEPDHTSEKGIGYYENASFFNYLYGYELILESWTQPIAFDNSKTLGATFYTNSDCTGESGIVDGREEEEVHDLEVFGFIDMNKMTVRSVRPALGTVVVLFLDGDILLFPGTLLGPRGSSYDDYGTVCYNVPDEFTIVWLFAAYT